MFRVQAPVVVIFSTESRAALGVQQRAAGVAAWRALAGLGLGPEMAHFQIVFAGVTLAVSSRLRPDGQAEARARSRHPLASHAH